MIDKPDNLAEETPFGQQPGSGTHPATPPVSSTAPADEQPAAALPPAEGTTDETGPDDRAQVEKDSAQTEPPAVPMFAGEPYGPGESSTAGASEATASTAEPDAVTGQPETASTEPDAVTGQPETPSAERDAATREPEVPTAEREAATAAPELAEAMDWYILKVQSNRENSIADALQRRVAIAGLEAYFGQVIVPTEKITEFKGGKKRVVHRKLYPGYILVQMAINDDTWFLVRETPGIGDFTGAGGKPTPMLPHEVKRIVSKQEEKTDAAPKLKVSFNTGDRVKINEGTFENFEGEVASFDQANGRVTVMINIFGRSTPVELEYWQIEPV